MFGGRFGRKKKATQPRASTRKINSDDTKTGSILFKAIEQRQWNSALSRIQHAPHEVETTVFKTGSFSILPLHQACMRKPPAVIVSSLIASYPTAVSTKCDKNLPLHHALKHGASVEVIKILIISHPDSLKEVSAEGKKPIEIFKNSKNAWNEEEQTIILKIIEGGVAEIDLDKDDSGSQASIGNSLFDIDGEQEALVPDLNEEGWKMSGLIVVVIGASGDLAKKKTYPSLLHLYTANLLPEDTHIWGFARSNITHEELRARIRPYIEKSGEASVIDAFLSNCFYKQGASYGDEKAYQELSTEMSKYEEQFPDKLNHNRLFYFAIPPNVFADTGVAIKQSAMADKGWTRIIVEKPFGRDLQSCEDILSVLAKNFEEDSLFRIDHYLGKEMVQNLLVLRFGNQWVERIWDRNSIQCVFLTFKEPFGTDGRGGYFDNYGIIRDIIQNHLLQVMTLLAMEPPIKVDGPESGRSIRDAKVAVLKSIEPIQIEDCCLGQYEGYTDDETIKNKETNTPTFAAIRCYINNPRWAGVPFILKAGKALDERKAEMRIQFKDAPAAEYLFDQKCARNELVIRMQPDEAIYFKTNVKSPGFSSQPVQSELEVNYNTKFASAAHGNLPDAYSRLILDVLRGRSAAFVREDELRRSWEIFTPLLHQIEDENIQPLLYPSGSRGPSALDDFITKESGYVRNTAYVFNGRKLSPGSKPGAVLAEVGLYGLAVMGQNFALNIASHGFTICVGNRSPTKVELTVKRGKKEGNLPLIGSSDPEDFIKKLQRPRKVILLVQAGKPVDLTIETLSKYMDAGDILVDGGNEYYPNTIRRATELESKGILFVGMGISGGEEGARNGPSLMPGGPKEAYDQLERILTTCAAQVKDGPCASYVGPIGSGNYVKMVHNGIEYGDMQLIAEAYDIMRHVCEMTNDEISQVFADWNKGKLESYLIEITAVILSRKDDITSKGHVVDYVLDKTGTKGTGKWTMQEAAEESVAAPTISGSLDARYISGRKDERVQASKILNGPGEHEVVDKKKLVHNIGEALYASKICSYAQGLSIIKAASEKYSWDVDLAACVRLWKGGCIIRAKLLNNIQAAFLVDPDLPNLMLDPSIALQLESCNEGWREVVITCANYGVACLSIGGSLNYYDSYRTESSPANLTQAQRDFFGGHTYERTDVPGPHHCVWTDSHKDIGDVNERTRGEMDS